MEEIEVDLDNQTKSKYTSIMIIANISIAATIISALALLTGYFLGAAVLFGIAAALCRANTVLPS